MYMTHLNQATNEHADREIEVRFVEVDEQALKQKLTALGAEDLGEAFLEEIIFYDQAGKWQYDEKKFVRIRRTNKGMFVTFKHNQEDSATGTQELEFQAAADQEHKIEKFLEAIGLIAYRVQQKKRHSYKLDNVLVEFDTWPVIPTYVELEGESEEALKSVAAKLGLNWSKVVFETARFLIEKYYDIPVSQYKYFTFGKVGND